MFNAAPDPISPMGRAVQAKTEGMTPDQVAALDQQYAKMGLMSINDVLTLKQQLDYMKQAGQQQQAGPPPATTVVQDMQQQMGGGLGSLPSNVGNPASYARGGIVAFAGSGLVPPYADAEARAIYEAAERAANEAAERGVRSVAPAGKTPGFLTKPRTIGGMSNWADVGQVAKSGAKYAIKHPGKVVKGGVKSYGLASLPFMAANAASLYSMDPRYLREAMGSEDPYGSGWSDVGRRFGAVLEDAAPSAMFYETAIERAKAAEKADKVKPQGQDWELEMARQVAELRRQGRHVEADLLSEQYRAMKSRPGDEGVDISKYLGGDGGLGGIAASMGLGGNPYGKANAFMGDSVNAFKGMIGDAPDRNAEIAAARGRREDAGIGKANVAAMDQYQKDLGELPEDKRRNKWLSAAEGFFKMAEAGGESGSTFWGAAGAGGTAGLSAYNKALDKLEVKEERLREKMLEVQRYDEQLRMGDITEGSAEYRRLMDRRDTATTNYAKALADRDKLAAEISMHEMNAQVNIAVARIQQSGRGLEAGKLRDAYVKAVSDNDMPAAEKIYGMILKLNASLPQVQAAEIRSENNMPWIGGMQQTGGTEATGGFRLLGQE